MKNVNFSRKWIGIKYRLFEVFKMNKKTTLIFVMIAIMVFSRGFLLPIKYSQGLSLIDFNDFSLSSYLKGELGTSSLFYSRLFSSCMVSLIIFISSSSIFFLPVNIFIIVYRAYLLSLNATIIIIFNGLSGILCTFFIIMPCQLISLFLIIMFCAYAFKYACVKRRYGICHDFKIWHKLLIFFFLLLILNLIETFLLYIFSSKIILVI